MSQLEPGYRWPLWYRAGLAVVGVVLLGMLVVARCLQPDPDGLGTHQQLGFPPCGFIIAFGRVCPSCGMTTAWSHFTRGNLAAGIDANVGGCLLALAAAPTGFWLVASGLRGTWYRVRPNPVLLISYAVAVLLATLIQWLLR